MILSIKRIGRKDTGHNATVSVEEINCPPCWPEGLKVEGILGGIEFFGRIFKNPKCAVYRANTNTLRGAMKPEQSYPKPAK